MCSKQKADNDRQANNRGSPKQLEHQPAQLRPGWQRGQHEREREDGGGGSRRHQVRGRLAVHLHRGSGSDALADAERFVRHRFGHVAQQRGEESHEVAELEGVWFYHRVSEGYHFTIAIWHMEGR